MLLRQESIDSIVVVKVNVVVGQGLMPLLECFCLKIMQTSAMTLFSHSVSCLFVGTNPSQVNLAWNFGRNQVLSMAAVAIVVVIAIVRSSADDIRHWHIRKDAICWKWLIPSRQFGNGHGDTPGGGSCFRAILSCMSCNYRKKITVLIRYGHTRHELSMISPRLQNGHKAQDENGPTGQKGGGDNIPSTSAGA